MVHAARGGIVMAKKRSSVDKVLQRLLSGRAPYYRYLVEMASQGGSDDASLEDLLDRGSNRSGQHHDQDRGVSRCC